MNKVSVGNMTKTESDNFLIKLGGVVRAARKSAKISQVDLGKLLSIHQTAVCRIEQGFQSLTPEQLFILAKHFDVKIDSFLAGDVDYWKIAARFGRTPPFPKRYTEMPYSRVRELLPLIEYLRKNRDEDFTGKYLEELKLKLELLRNPDQTVGVNCNLDLLRHSLKRGMVNKKNLKKLTDQTRTEAVQGFLHPIYSKQTSPLHLIQTWILSSHHYESNFHYEIEDLGRKSLDLAIVPASHMRDVDYRDEILGDFLCEYKKSYIENFPAYIGGKQLELTEKECHFHGHSKCVYRLKVAS